MGAAGLAAIPHHCYWSLVADGPKTFGKERGAFPKRKGSAGAYARPDTQELLGVSQFKTWPGTSQVGAPGWGSHGWPHTCRCCGARVSPRGQRLLIEGESVIFACYTARPPDRCRHWRSAYTPFFIRSPMSSLPHSPKQILEGVCTKDLLLPRAEVANQVCDEEESSLLGIVHPGSPARQFWGGPARVPVGTEALWSPVVAFCSYQLRARQAGRIQCGAEKMAGLELENLGVNLGLPPLT